MSGPVDKLRTAWDRAIAGHNLLLLEVPRCHGTTTFLRNKTKFVPGAILLTARESQARMARKLGLKAWWIFDEPPDDLKPTTIFVDQLLLRRTLTGKYLSAISASVRRWLKTGQDQVVVMATVTRANTPTFRMLFTSPDWHRIRFGYTTDLVGHVQDGDATATWAGPLLPEVWPREALVERWEVLGVERFTDSFHMEPLTVPVPCVGCGADPSWTSAGWTCMVCSHHDDADHVVSTEEWNEKNAPGEQPSTEVAPVQDATGETSDGYHTFNELYEHRHVLFIGLCNSLGAGAWKSRLHHDGTMFDGDWFIAGLHLLGGETITYHLPGRLWDLLRSEELDRAPEWDGHTPQDVVTRLTAWAKAEAAGDGALADWRCPACSLEFNSQEVPPVTPGDRHPLCTCGERLVDPGAQ